MWTLVVVGFAVLVGLLIRHAIRLGRPRRLLLLPIGLIGFVLFFGWLNYLWVVDEMNRTVVRSLSDIRADETNRPLLIAAKIEEGGQGEWARININYNLTADAVLTDGSLEVKANHVYGEKISHSLRGIRRGAEIFIDGEAHGYTNGRFAVHNATVYTWSLENVRADIGLARWPLVAGMAAGGVALLYFLWGLFRWKRQEPPSTGASTPTPPA